jgi:hypothetical protein
MSNLTPLSIFAAPTTVPCPAPLTAKWHDSIVEMMEMASDTSDVVDGTTIQLGMSSDCCLAQYELCELANALLELKVTEDPRLRES